MAEIAQLIDVDVAAKIREEFAGKQQEEAEALEPFRSETGVWMVPVSLCRPDFDARQTYDVEETERFNAGIAALAEERKGIEGTGIDTPVILRTDPADSSRYLIRGGRRRWRAVVAYGGQYLPAAIQDVDDVESEESAVRENVARSGLSEVEAGDAFLRMVARGDTISKIALKMNVSEGVVNNRLRVARKPDDIKEMVQAASTPTRSVMAHADQIDKVTNENERKRLIKKVIEEKAPLKVIEEEVKELDKLGLVKRSVTLGSPAPQNGTIGNKTKPAPVYIDWTAIERDGKNATYNILRNCRDHSPRGENRDKMLDLIAKMQKELKESLEYLGAEI